MKPPSNSDIEKSLIGCLLQEPSLLHSVQGEGGGNLFYSSRHQDIYRAIQEQSEIGEVDNVTVASRLEIDGIRSYLIDCQMNAPTVLMAKTYAETLKDLHIKREIIRVCQQTIYNIENPDIINQVETGIREVVAQISRVSYVDFVDVASDMWERYIDNEGKEPDYMRTGLTDLDRVIDGLERGEHIIVAGRPGMGKTALATDITRNIAKQFKKVQFFTMEMNREALTRRIICAEANVSLKDYRNRKLNPEQKVKAARVLNMVKRGIIRIYDKRVTVSEIKSEVAKHDPDLVVVDYLQLMALDRRGSMTTNDLVGDNAIGLQSIAKSGPAVITLSQLSRTSEKEKRRPGLSDLLDSGKIEAVGDKILMPYREDKESTSAEILIVKQKDGAIGKVDVTFLPESVSFRNLDKYH